MIYVIESLMGTGKTTNMYSYINAHSDQKYMFITPLLNEFERLKLACPTLGFQDPQPYPTKEIHLRKQIAAANNIVTSHELIKRIKVTDEDRNIIYENGYTLIIDEAVTTISSIPDTNKADYEALQALSVVSREEDGKTSFITEDLEKIPKRYHDLIEISKTGNLYSYDSFMLWKLPLDFITCFEDVYIMTYNFEGSHMAYDLKVAKLPYKICHFENGEIVEGKQNVTPFIEAFKDRVTVYDGKLNEIGEKTFALSASQWSKFKEDKDPKGKHEVEDIMKKFRSIFINHGQPVDRCMYTRYKRKEDQEIDGKLVPKFNIRDYRTANLVPFNCTGTNDYRLKTSMIYGVNVYEHPAVVNYYRARESKENPIGYNPDNFALNTLLQWIYRSAIRNTNVPKDDPFYKVFLAIPSKRMRIMLQEWLEKAVA